MAGIYIHIPFCRQACHYCDFHFSTNIKLKEQMLQAIRQELNMQQSYLAKAKVTSIYLGGGTPSLLEATEVGELLVCIRQLFTLAEQVEVTLEANPDDLSLAKLQALRAIGINRLSVGVQSFQNRLLHYLNRAHDSSQAIASIELASQAGFDNISIDLIYAITGQSDAMWQQDLAMAIRLQLAHIAAYCLTIEKNTVFGRWLQQGRLWAIADEVAARQFALLRDVLVASHYEHYEISSFSLPQRYAWHNTNYWKQGSYLGVGPGAHSYNGATRQYNVAHNQRYIQSIQQGIVPSTIEVLQRRDHINEYIMTRLRTKWGCDMDWLKAHYHYDLQQEQIVYLDQLVHRQLALVRDNRLVLTPRGMLLADKIALDLFVA